MEKVIPKVFNGLNDLEAMLLTSLLGVMVGLKEDLISIQQGESYWLNETVIDTFKDIHLSDEMIDIYSRSLQIKNVEYQSEQYYQMIDEMLTAIKDRLGTYYTEYDELPVSILN